MIEIDPFDVETMPWRTGGRQDRDVLAYEASVPGPIAGLSTARLRPDGDLASASRDAEVAIRLLDQSSGSALASIEPFLARSEAIASSKIEREMTTVDQLARAQVGIKAPRSARSVFAAMTGLKKLVEHSMSGPITLSAILAAHRCLMEEDRFEASYAGRLRDMQNWIGGSDYSPRGAAYVPPAPERVEALMADLVAFVNREDLDPVTQAALAHAQFESIHPFTDGNGRVGRSLINAVWRRRGLTTQVTVPVAAALAGRRETYFAALARFRDGEAEPLVVLLGDAAIAAAAEARESAATLSGLPGRWRESASPRAGSAADKLIDLLVANPVLDADRAARLVGASEAAGYRAIGTLVEAGVLRPITESKRNQAWAAGAVLDEADALIRRLAL
ncbi:MAG: Fic family protein [Bifidobacteriaceae bacterium]|nr:Fic family protein [Bifidobacteriaceae bacterium]